MGIKFFLSRLHTIPWSFHLMGHRISCVQFQPDPPVLETIKLIKWDGLVKIYDRPIHVSELMLEFPKHLVCRSDSFYIGQKIPALSENDQLQPGQNYFLLPQHCFQSVLSFVTIASLTKSNKVSGNELLKKAANCKPFDIQKSPSGCLRIRVSDEFIARLMEEGKMNDTGKDQADEQPTSKVCTTTQLQKDYTLLVGHSRQWKPKLETIKEKEKEKRKLSSSFGMKRRKNSHHQSKGSQKTITTHRSSASASSSGAHQQHQYHNGHVHSPSSSSSSSTSSTRPSSKSKIKIKSRKGEYKYCSLVIN